MGAINHWRLSTHGGYQSMEVSNRWWLSVNGAYQSTLAMSPSWPSINGGYQLIVAIMLSTRAYKTLKLHSTVRLLTKLGVVNECLRNKEAEASAVRDNIKTNKNK